jgi:hypothetical protein
MSQQGRVGPYSISVTAVCTMAFGKPHHLDLTPAGPLDGLLTRMRASGSKRWQTAFSVHGFRAFLVQTRRSILNSRTSAGISSRDKLRIAIKQTFDAANSAALCSKCLNNCELV